MRRSGSEVLLEALADEGVRHVFGNPGTTEPPFVDALVGRGEPQYVLALQEATAGVNPIRIEIAAHVGGPTGYGRAPPRGI